MVSASSPILYTGVDAAPMVVVDAPMAVVVPPARRNPVRARNQLFLCEVFYPVLI